MSRKIAFVILLIACRDVGGASSEFYQAFSKYLGLATSQQLILYRMPLSPVKPAAPAQEQEQTAFLVDLIPTNKLAADDPPRVSLRQNYHSVLYAARPGIARWKSEDLAAYVAARDLIFRPARASDVLRGESISLEPTVRADTFLRRSLKPGYQSNDRTRNEDRLIQNAFRIFNEGGNMWPTTRHVAALSKCENERIRLYPAPLDIPASPLWTRLDLTPFAGKPCRVVEMLRVQIVFDAIDEDFLHGTWWDCAAEDLRQRGVGFPIATGKAPFANETVLGIPWLPRQLILFRPPTDQKKQELLSDYDALNVDGPCAIGLIAEVLGPLPNFDKTSFVLPSR